jgi:hypothetical protein
MDRAHRGGDWAEPHVEDATSRLDLGAERGSDGSEKCAMEKHLPFSQCGLMAWDAHVLRRSSRVL